MTALTSVSMLVQFLFCTVVAVGLDSVCTWNTGNRSTSKGSPCATIQIQRCIRRTSHSQAEVAVFSREVTLLRGNAEAPSGVAHGRIVPKFRRTARTQVQWLPNVHPSMTQAFLMGSSPAIKDVAVGDTCASGHPAGHGSAVTTMYRKARGRRQRDRIRGTLCKNRMRQAYESALQGRRPMCPERDSGQQAESPTVQPSEAPVVLCYIRNIKYTWPRCRLKRTVYTSRLPAAFSSGFSLSKVAWYRLPGVAPADVAGPLIQGVYHLQNNRPSVLPSPLCKSEAPSFRGAGVRPGELPETPAQDKGGVTIGMQLPPSVRGETDIFLRPGDPLETCPLPPTRTSYISLNPTLLRPTAGIEGSYSGLEEDDSGEQLQQQEMLQQRSVSSEWTKSANDPHEERLRGPLSMYEWQGKLALARNLEGPEDIYVLDFDTVIQLNLREVINTAIRAWKHLEEESSATDTSGSRWSIHSTASSLMPDNPRKETGTRRADKPDDVVHSATETSSLPAVGAASGRRLSKIFSKQRFAGMECPAWLEARMRDARRSLTLRGSPDFMVAMRRIVELMMYVEEARGSTIDSAVERQEKSFQDKWEETEPAGKMCLVTKNGNFFDIQDILKFRRGSADATGTKDDCAYPWIVRTLQGWETTGDRTALYERYNTTEAELQQAFDYARAVWKEADRKSWNEHVKYRNSVIHIDPVDTDRLGLYEGFNPAAIWCLNNHINNFRRPVHILSVWETSAEVLSMLHLMGLSAVDGAAARLVHIYGRDTVEHLVAAEVDHAVKPASIERTANKEGWSLTPAALREEDATARLKRSAVSYILRGWRAGKDAWKPVHIVDGNVRSLLALRDLPELSELRLYFCEWGHSTIEDKTIAFLASRIKYMKHSMELVKIMSTPANIPARQWTHGYTSCPPNWMEDCKVRRWLRWCDFIREDDTVLQDIAVPEQPAN